MLIKTFHSFIGLSIFFIGPIQSLFENFIKHLISFKLLFLNFINFKNDYAYTMQKKYLSFFFLLIFENIICVNFILETARLKIRPFNHKDYDLLYPLLSDPQVMAHSRDGFLDIDATKAYLDKRIIAPFIKQGWGRYALFNKIDGDFIGFCGLTVHKLEDNKDYVELGYKLIRKFWNQGYATEAAMDIKNYARDVLGIKEIISIIEPSNLASIKIAQKIGLKFWKKSLFNNEIVDVYRIIFD